MPNTQGSLTIVASMLTVSVMEIMASGVSLRDSNLYPSSFSFS